MVWKKFGKSKHEVCLVDSEVDSSHEMFEIDNEMIVKYLERLTQTKQKF